MDSINVERFKIKNYKFKSIQKANLYQMILNINRTYCWIGSYNVLSLKQVKNGDLYPLLHSLRGIYKIVLKYMYINKLSHYKSLKCVYFTYTQEYVHTFLNISDQKLHCIKKGVKEKKEEKVIDKTTVKYLSMKIIIFYNCIFGF